MAIAKIYRGTVKAGRMIPDDPQGYALRFCGHEGKRVQETVERERKQGSKAQRGYYRGCVIYLIAANTGQGADDVAYEMRRRFLSPIDDDGKKIGIPRSTSTLSTVEMEEYLSKIRQWASEFLGVYIPLPNEIEVK
jgi:hypothetical protein